MRYVLIVLLVATPAFADEVKLQSGATVTGRVKENPGNPDKVEIEMGLGTIWVDRKDVLSIEKGRTALDEYDERFAEIKGSSKAQDFVDLAAWAKGKKLTRYVKPLMETVLKLDPNNEAARKDLGYHMYQGKWMTREEMNRAKGMVEFDGRWMTTAEKELLIQKRLAARERAVADRAEKAKREEEEERRRAERQEEIEAAMNSPYGYYYRPSEFWPAYHRSYGGVGRRRASYGYGGYWDAQPTFDIFDFVGGGNIKKK